MSTEVAYQCSCSCGETTFNVTAEPIMRGVCHCQVCQEFNQAAFADIVLVRAKHIEGLNDDNIDYRCYQKPEMIFRGKCKACGEPAIEFLKTAVAPNMAIVPVANFQNDAELPDPAMHIFYHRRVEDMDDTIPKHSGYLKSQLAFTGKLVLEMIKGK